MQPLPKLRVGGVLRRKVCIGDCQRRRGIGFVHQRHRHIPVDVWAFLRVKAQDIITCREQLSVQRAVPEIVVNAVILDALLLDG